jgi:hypothetical protein
VGGLFKDSFHCLNLFFSRCAPKLCSLGGTYKGYFEGDKMHGHGTRTFADGSSYTGKWAKNKAHGTGTIKLPLGKTFFDKEFTERKCVDSSNTTWSFTVGLKKIEVKNTAGELIQEQQMPQMQQQLEQLEQQQQQQQLKQRREQQQCNLSSTDCSSGPTCSW